MLALIFGVSLLPEMGQGILICKVGVSASISQFLVSVLRNSAEAVFSPSPYEIPILIFFPLASLTGQGMFRLMSTSFASTVQLLAFALMYEAATDAFPVP